MKFYNFLFIHYTALTLAIEKKYYEMVSILLTCKRLDVNQKVILYTNFYTVLKSNYIEYNSIIKNFNGILKYFF